MENRDLIMEIKTTELKLFGEYLLEEELIDPYFEEDKILCMAFNGNVYVWTSEDGRVKRIYY